MSKEVKNTLLNCAKGSWQYSIIQDFISYGTITNPIINLQGKARSYSNKYQTSFNALKNRIEKSGFTITQRLGSHGGDWGATYTINL